MSTSEGLEGSVNITTPDDQKSFIQRIRRTHVIGPILNLVSDHVLPSVVKLAGPSKSRRSALKAVSTRRVNDVVKLLERLCDSGGGDVTILKKDNYLIKKPLTEEEYKRVLDQIGEDEDLREFIDNKLRCVRVHSS